MKAVYCLLAVGAAAMAPPRIELDLSAMAAVKNDADGGPPSTMLDGPLSSISGVKDAVHDFEGKTAAEGGVLTTTDHATPGATKKVTSRQDWSQTCEASSADATSCPFPVAKAYDHNDQSRPVYTNVYLIDYDGESTFAGSTLPKQIFSNDEDPSDLWTDTQYKNTLGGMARMTLLFKYDAVDEAGNRAQQVVFALILNDVTAPTVTGCYSDTAVTVEAGTAHAVTALDVTTYPSEFFCVANAFKVTPKIASGTDISSTAGADPVATASHYTATDDVDTIDAADIKFNIFTAISAGSTSKASATAEASGKTLAQARAALPTVLAAGTSKHYVVEAYVSDSAGYYGSDGHNNEGNNLLAVTVEDTEGPLIDLTGQATAMAQCCRSDHAANTANGNTACTNTYTDARATGNDSNDGTIAWSDFAKTGSITVPSGIDAAQTLVSDGVVSGTELTVDVSAVADKNIYYYAADAAGNPGVWTDTDGNQHNYAHRVVSVMDTEKPTIALSGSATVTIKSSKTLGDKYAAVMEVDGDDADNKDPGVVTDDTCVSSLQSVTTSWKDGNEPTGFADVGDYTRIYKVCDRVAGGSTAGDCADADKLWGTADPDGKDRTHCCRTAAGKAEVCCATVERVFQVVDDEAPTIQVMGTPDNSADPLEASNTEEYTDAGASCTDYVDGVLSHAVEVSGEVVNMRVPGTYTIRYDCIDLSGKEADPAYRTVVVADNTAPVCALQGTNGAGEAVGGPGTVFVEAGFKYEDAGFVCTDTLDGDITGQMYVESDTYADAVAGCITDGDTVNVAQEFYNRHSCKDIKENCAENKCGSGEYYITVVASSETKRLLVWCNMESGKTYFPVTNAVTPAVPETTGSNDCENLYGMEMATFADAAEKSMAQAKFPSPAAGTSGPDFWPTLATVATNQYLCSVNDEANPPSATALGHPDLHMGTEGAEVGKYEIQFRCMDKSGNKDTLWAAGTPLTRTVTVKDTLPPVISLHLQGTMIAHGKGDQLALDGSTVNPAGTAAGNPNIPDASLMAEESTSSVNGWIVGALASAISGLALLGYSLRKSNDVATSVPV